MINETKPNGNKILPKKNKNLSLDKYNSTVSEAKKGRNFDLDLLNTDHFPTKNTPYIQKFSSLGLSKDEFLLIKFQKIGKRKTYTITIDNSVHSNVVKAFSLVMNHFNNHTPFFFYRVHKTIQYIKSLCPSLVGASRLKRLNLMFANYTNVSWFEIFSPLKNKESSSFLPPKKHVTVSGEVRNIYGLELMLEWRLEELGAYLHLKSVMRCSTSFIHLAEYHKNLISAYNVVCRKSCCVYCSRLVKKDDERSQAITERGKKHFRYGVVGGKVKSYGRLVFTLPKVIQNQIDRKDMKEYLCYDNILDREIKLKKEVRVIDGKIREVMKSTSSISWEKELEDFDREKIELESVLMDVAKLKDFLKVYGSKYIRELMEIEKQKKEADDIIDKDERKKVKARLRKRCERLRNRKKKLENLKTKMEAIKEEMKILRREKQVGYASRLVLLRKEKKKLRKKILKETKIMEEGRIALSVVQRSVSDFMLNVLGVKGALITPHLTGDESSKKGECHFHFHTFFPLFGDEKYFDWSKGEPFVSDLSKLNEDWKNFLNTKYGIEVEDVANPYYKYLSGGADKRSVTEMAFYLRYDHRYETGGAIFQIFANDDDARKLLRLNTRQRATRGYGILSDRNLRAFDREVGGESLKYALIEQGDSEAVQSSEARNEYKFDLNLLHKKALEAGIFTEELRHEFSLKGIWSSEDAVISTQKYGKRWIVFDEECCIKFSVVSNFSVVDGVRREFLKVYQEECWEALTVERIVEDVPWSPYVEDDDGILEDKCLNDEGNFSDFVEDEKKKLAFVKYAKDLGKRTIETGLEILYYHSCLGVFSRWQKKWKNGEIKFSYYGALCELPEGVEEVGNGFFTWKSDLSDLRFLIEPLFANEQLSFKF